MLSNTASGQESQNMIPKISTTSTRMLPMMGSIASIPWIWFKSEMVRETTCPVRTWPIAAGDAPCRAARQRMRMSC